MRGGRVGARSRVSQAGSATRLNPTDRRHSAMNMTRTSRRLAGETLTLVALLAVAVVFTAIVAG